MLEILQKRQTHTDACVALESNMAVKTWRNSLGVNSSRGAREGRNNSAITPGCSALRGLKAA